MASSIRAAIARPFVVAGSEVEVGISIGLAHATDDLGADALERADRDLYRDKGDRRRRATDPS